MKVTILEKPVGQSWSPEEVNAICGLQIEVEGRPRKPERIVAMNKPLRAGTFQSAVGHSNFTTREVDYCDCWS